MIGYCEAEAADAPNKNVDLYVLPGVISDQKISIWLCEEHRP